MTAATKQTVEEYISTYPVEVQEKLEQIRHIVKSASPEAEEVISYGVPTFKLNGTYLVYYAAYKNHISMYPIPDGTEKFNEEIAEYKAGKGTLQFPLDKPMPWELVKKIVNFSLQTNIKRTEDKKKKAGAKAKK